MIVNWLKSVTDNFGILLVWWFINYLSCFNPIYLSASNVLPLLFRWKPTACMLKNKTLSKYFRRLNTADVRKGSRVTETICSSGSNIQVVTHFQTYLNFSLDICYAWLCSSSLLEFQYEKIQCLKWVIQRPDIRKTLWRQIIEADRHLCK